MKLIGKHQASGRDIYINNGVHYCVIEDNYVKINGLSEEQLQMVKPLPFSEEDAKQYKNVLNPFIDWIIQNDKVEDGAFLYDYIEEYLLSVEKANILAGMVEEPVKEKEISEWKKSVEPAIVSEVKIEQSKSPECIITMEKDMAIKEFKEFCMANTNISREFRTIQIRDNVDKNIMHVNVSCSVVPDKIERFKIRIAKYCISIFDKDSKVTHHTINDKEYFELIKAFYSGTGFVHQ